MKLIFGLLAFSLALSGCASTPDAGDLPLQSPAASVSISVADGLPAFPGSGYYLAVPGYIFVAGRMVTHPGTRRISYACPGEWKWQQLTHFTPSVEHEFVAGHAYELYCDGGYPKIRELL